MADISIILLLIATIFVIWFIAAVSIVRLGRSIDKMINYLKKNRLYRFDEISQTHLFLPYLQGHSVRVWAYIYGDKDNSDRNILSMKNNVKRYTKLLLVSLVLFFLSMFVMALYSDNNSTIISNIILGIGQIEISNLVFPTMSISILISIGFFSLVTIDSDKLREYLNKKRNTQQREINAENSEKRTDFENEIRNFQLIFTKYEDDDFIIRKYKTKIKIRLFVAITFSIASLILWYYHP